MALSYSSVQTALGEETISSLSAKTWTMSDILILFLSWQPCEGSASNNCHNLTCAEKEEGRRRYLSHYPSFLPGREDGDSRVYPLDECTDGGKEKDSIKDSLYVIGENV